MRSEELGMEMEILIQNRFSKPLRSTAPALASSTSRSTLWVVYVIPLQPT